MFRSQKIGVQRPGYVIRLPALQKGMLMQIPKPLVLGGCAAALLALSSPASRAQTIGANFAGQSFLGGAVSIPLGTDGAIGPTIMSGSNAGIKPYTEFLNGIQTVYNAQTGATLAQTTDDQFWSSANVSLGSDLVSDPRVIFDPAIGRWLATSITIPIDSQGNPVITDNRFLIAVSKTADPTDLTDGWSKFAIDTNPASGDKDFFADFDQLGVNADNLYIGTNQFGGSTNEAQATFQSTGFAVIPLASLTSATPSTAGSQLIPYVDYNATGPTAHPVINLDNSSEPEYVLSDNNTDQDPSVTALVNTVQVSNITGGSISTSGGTVTVEGGLQEPVSGARQPDGAAPIETNDARFSGNVIEQNGDIWGVQTVATGGASSHDEIRWIEIDAASKQLVGEGLLGDSNYDYSFGSIAVNGQGSVVVACTRSGPDEVGPDGTGYASSVAFVGHTLGGVTSFDSPILLQPGTGTWDITGIADNRWGDFSTISVDPEDPTHFWTDQEIALGDDQGIGIDDCQTQITELTVLAAPEPGPLALFAIGFGALCLAGFKKRIAPTAKTDR